VRLSLPRLLPAAALALAFGAAPAHAAVSAVSMDDTGAANATIALADSSLLGSIGAATFLEFPDAGTPSAGVASQGDIPGFPSDGNFAVLSGGDVTNSNNDQLGGANAHGDAFDVTTLGIGLNLPNAGCLEFDYYYLSNENLTSNFGDPFVAQIDDSDDWNLPSDHLSVTGTNIFGSALQGVTPMSTGAAGLDLATGTGTLHAATSLLPAGTHTLTFSISDGGDDEVVSAVAIDRLRLTGCTGGGGAPILLSMSSHGGPTAGGQTFTITGENFSDGVGVLFGNQPASSVILNSSKQLTVVSPAHAAGAVDVRVIQRGGLSDPNGFDGYTFTAPAGAPAPQGTPRHDLCTMPDLEHHSYRFAVRRLRRSGCLLPDGSNFSHHGHAKHPPSHVKSQSPAAGSTVSSDSPQISLRLG